MIARQHHAVGPARLRSNSPARCSGRPRRSRPGRIAVRPAGRRSSRWSSRTARRPYRGSARPPGPPTAARRPAATFGLGPHVALRARLGLGTRGARRAAKQCQGVFDQLARQRARRRAARPADPACARAARASRGPDAPAARPVRHAPAAARTDCRPPCCSARRPAPFVPRRTARRINSTTVVVLPVPGGPWISATSRADRAKSTVHCCCAFNPGSRAASSCSSSNSGCRSPSKTSRNWASRSPRARCARSSAARWRWLEISSLDRSSRQKSTSSASSGSWTTAIEIASSTPIVDDAAHG